LSTVFLLRLTPYVEEITDDNNVDIGKLEYSGSTMGEYSRYFSVLKKPMSQPDMKYCIIISLNFLHM
jgi:hypothetical protein